MEKSNSDLAFGGLYAKLKDRNVSLVDKLQVFRFAWKSKDVFLPNKEQVLIDQLCGYLLNKKKHQFTEEETGKIFKCLHDLLLSKKAHRKQCDGQGLLVKQSLSQMLTETLWTQTDGSPANEDYLRHVLGCCQAIISSPTLSYVFTDRLDLMISLQGSLCAMLYTHITQGKHHTHIDTVLMETTNLFAKCQNTAHNQNMILRTTFEKLLPHFVKLFSVCRSEEVIQVASNVLNVLCHKDHRWSYVAYLLGIYEDKLPDEADFVRIKLINDLFNTFIELIKIEASAHEAICDILVQFFAKSVESKRNEEDSKTSHYLLKKLCTLIGLKEAKSVPLETDSSPMETDSSPLETDSFLLDTVAPPTVIKGVGELLGIVLKCDLYNVSADNRNEHIQLKFYRTIVKLLLDNVCQTVDWYTCCHTLLQLNHLTLEPSLIALLTKGWITVKIQSDELVCQMDEFLQELAVTYHKLRQFPRLVHILINTMNVSSPIGNVEFTPKFVKSFGDCVQALPQNTMVTVWTHLLVHMIQEFVTDQPIKNTGHFRGVVMLLYHYITNVKVIDYSITEATLTSVKVNLEKMSTDLFLPLLKERKNDMVDVSCLSSILNLCHGWGEVVGLLVMYTQHRTDDLKTKVVPQSSHDMTYLHDYLKKKHERVETTGNMCLKYYWDLLTIQKIRTILLCRDVSDWSVIHESMETLIQFPSSLSHENLTVSWSGMADDITNDNILVARWNLVVSNMPILYANLSTENMENLAMFIVNTALKMEQSDRRGLTLCSITQDLLEGRQIQEYGRLVTCIITAVWQITAECMSGTKHRSKKRKSGAGLEPALNVFKTLSNTDVDWKTAINSEILEKILEASKFLTTLLQTEDQSATSVPKSRVTCCLQVIRCLPLEHLSSSDQIRCLIGLLSTKCLLDSEVNQSDSKDCLDLSAECIQLSTVILESSGMSPIFQVIDLDVYLTWLSSLLGKQSKMDSSFYKMMLFIEFSCLSVIKDYKVLVKLPAFVQKIQTQMMDKDFDAGLHTGLLVLVMYLYQEASKMLSKPYLNEGLKESCSSIQTCLSKQLLSLLTLLDHGKHNITEAIVLNSFSTMVYSSVKMTELQPELTRSFPSVLKYCENVLQSTATEMFPKMAALHVLHSVSRCHKVFDSVLNADTKQHIWSLLVGVLKDLLKKRTAVVNSSIQTLNIEGSVKRKSEELERGIEDVAAGVDVKCISDLLHGNSDGGIAGNKKLDLLQNESEAPTCYSAFRDFPDDKVYRSSAISSLYHSLAYEGRVQDQSTMLLLVEVQAVMASLLASFDLDNFTSIVEKIVGDVHTCTLTTDRQTIQCFLFVWQYLLKLEFSAEHSQIIRSAAEKMVSNCQCILQQVQHHSGQQVVMDTVLPILQSLCQMLNISQRFLSGKTVALCLQGCVGVPLDGATLFPVFRAVCDILDTLLIKHINIVVQNIPTFIGCAKKLLVSLVKHSDQKALVGNTTAVSNLSNCAYQLERLFLEISNHKVHFNKVAVYVISDYVTAVEQVTLLPSLKRALLPIIHKMLDLCDTFAIAQLHKILSYGEVEVFKILYNDYTKFHKFSGKV